MTASVQNKQFLFGVVYDDDSFGEEAKKTKSLVKFMVSEVEAGLKALNSDDRQWRGYYTARDGLPGENKMRRYINLAQKCQYIICVITKNVITKGLPSFYVEITKYIQQEKDCESYTVPVFHDMTEEEVHKVKGMEGELSCLMLDECLIIPKKYDENTSEWTSRIIGSLHKES